VGYLVPQVFMTGGFNDLGTFRVVLTRAWDWLLANTETVLQLLNQVSDPTRRAMKRVKAWARSFSFCAAAVCAGCDGAGGGDAEGGPGEHARDRGAP
jgi:hypothetical protein